MVKDSDKYRSTMFQISGFALMSPTGKVIMNIYDYGFGEFFTFKFLMCLLVDFVLFCIGIILLLRGFEILEGEESKWIKNR